MLSRASPVAGPHLGRPASLPPVRVPLAQWPCWARGLLPREPFPVPCGYRVCRIPLRAGDLAGFAGFPVGVGWKIARYPEGSRGATRWSCRFSTFLSPSTGLTWPDASCLIDLSSGFSHRSVISLNCWSDDRCDLSLDDSQETKRSSRRVIAGVRCPSTLLGPGLWPAAGIFAVRALRPMPDLPCSGWRPGFACADEDCSVSGRSSQQRPRPRRRLHRGACGPRSDDASGTAGWQEMSGEDGSVRKRKVRWVRTAGVVLPRAMHPQSPARSASGR